MGIHQVNIQPARVPNTRAVFLDRDGVIDRAIIWNGKPYPPPSINELEILPGVEQALASLHGKGFRLIVVTNQPDVARGIQSQEVVDAMHQWLFERLPLDAVFTCYHDDSDECNCRKPSPGLLLQAAAEFNIDLTASYMVGDRWRDIEAGKRAGCKTFFIDYGYDEQLLSQPDIRVNSLSEVANWILQFESSAQ